MNPIADMNPVTGSLRVWLRLEGLATLTISLCLYQRHGAPWLIFAILFLLPDLSMLGYLTGALVGAIAYNIAHSYILPIMLIIFAILTARVAVVPYALIWIAHIGFDRMLGYGLKYGSAFGHTHLGWIGRQQPEE